MKTAKVIIAVILACSLMLIVEADQRKRSNELFRQQLMNYLTEIHRRETLHNDRRALEKLFQRRRISMFDDDDDDDDDERLYARDAKGVGLNDDPLK